MTATAHEDEAHDLNVAALISAGDFNALRSLLQELRPPEIADAFSDLSNTDRMLALSLVEIETAALVFPSMPDDVQLSLLEESTGDQLREIIGEMSPDDRIGFFSITPPELLPKLLSYLNPLERKNAQALLDYPPDSIGRMITPNYVTVRSEWTPEHVLRYIRRYGEEAESFDSLYVVDDHGVLVDEVSLRSVLLADPKDTVASLVDGHVVFLNANDDREQAVHAMERYDQPVLPVVDDKMRMLGIITFDDIADVAQKEATEDFHKLAGIDPIDRSYRTTGVFTLFATRIRWLIILIGVNIFSSWIISAYESTLEKMLALTFFLPLLIGSGGNAGSQAATLMIRALATKDIEISHWVKVLLKELGLGALLGIAMGLSSFILGYLSNGIEVGLIVGLSMFAIVIFANILGTILPFILTRLKVDPAIASSPLITTLADATGLLIYFSIASRVMTG